MKSSTPLAVLTTLCFLSSMAYGSDSLDTTTTIRNNTTAGTDELDDKNAYSAKYTQSEKEKVIMKDQMSQLESELQDLKAQAGQHVPSQTQQPQTQNVAQNPYAQNSPADTSLSTQTHIVQDAQATPAVFPTTPAHQTPTDQHVSHKSIDSDPSPHVMIFETSTPHDNASGLEENRTIIPAGSWVKVKVLGGVEAVADTQQPFPMLLQADYAFQGPNGYRINMKNCLFEAKTNANLSTERVLGQVTVLSCVRDSGKYERRDIKGYLEGDDSTFGIVGKLISRQGAVLAAAAVASLAKGASEAISTAQTSTTVVAGSTGAPASATNVTGSQGAYILGQAIADPATIVTNWYLKYAEQLVPAIAVGSGTDAFVVLQDEVEIPTLNDSDEEKNS